MNERETAASVAELTEQERRKAVAAAIAEAEARGEDFDWWKWEALRLEGRL
jgi:hypothetical protein